MAQTSGEPKQERGEQGRRWTSGPLLMKRTSPQRSQPDPSFRECVARADHVRRPEMATKGPQNQVSIDVRLLTVSWGVGGVVEAAFIHWNVQKTRVARRKKARVKRARRMQEGLLLVELQTLGGKMRGRWLAQPSRSGIAKGREDEVSATELQ